MSGKVLYFKNAVTNGAMALQDGGTAPVSGITTTGWNVGKDAAGSFLIMTAGSEVVPFQATDALVPPSFSASSCWRSEQPFSGRFASGNWELDFRVRAASNASGQCGRVRCRLWKSASAVGIPATELTSAVLIGTTTPAIPQNAAVSSNVTWTAVPALMFSNEYLFVQCEWEITTATTNAGADVLFYVDSTTNIATPDFAWPLAPPFHDDITEFFAPSPIILVNTLVDALFHDDMAEVGDAYPPTVTKYNPVGPQLVDSDEEIMSPALAPGPVKLTSYNPYVDVDEVWPAIIMVPARFPMEEFIRRWQMNEYNLFRTRMRGVTFIGPGMIRKWDLAIVTGYLDTSDEMMPAFKKQLVIEGIISQERADIIFDGIV